MNDKTFNELLTVHRNRLFSAAVYVLRNEQDAEDVVQEAFLRLWRFTGQIDAQRVPAWLSRVVHNLCIDQTRRRKSLQRHLGRPDETALERLRAPDVEAARWRPGGDLDPEQENLLEAMGTLSAETRSIMIMHYFQGLKLTEIAEMLDVSPSAVKVRVHRARRALRLVLDKPERDCAAKQETG